MTSPRLNSSLLGHAHMRMDPEHGSHYSGSLSTSVSSLSLSPTRPQLRGASHGREHVTHVVPRIGSNQVEDPLQVRAMYNILPMHHAMCRPAMHEHTMRVYEYRYHAVRRPAMQCGSHACNGCAAMQT